MDPNDKKYSVCFVEDDPLVKEMVSDFIQSIPQLSLEKVTGDGIIAEKILKSRSFDLLILDIQIQEINIFDILNRVRNYSYIIFVSSLDNFAIKAFEIGAIDYILKPVSFERFSQAVNRFLSIKSKNGPSSLRNVSENATNQTLFFKFKNKLNAIPLNRVVYISAYRRNTILETEDEQIISPFSISEIIKEIPEKLFIRIHKSYIINISKVKQLVHNKSGLYDVILNDLDDTMLPVGRKYSATLKNIYKL